MAEKGDILVFSQGRSGGGTLQFGINAILNNKRICAENLNSYVSEVDDYVKEEYLEIPVEDLPVVIFQREFRHRLENLMEEYAGIKHNITNFTYYYETRDEYTGLWFELDKIVLDYFDKVVINDRKNWLKWAISFKIANYLDVYNIHSESDRENYEKIIEEDDRFKIDLKHLSKYIVKYKREWNKRIAYIESLDIPHIYASYEDIYTIPHQFTISRFQDIIEFLGIEFQGDSLQNDQRINDLFSPDRKVSGKDKNYSLIKNIDTINEVLGPKYGYLFEPEN